MHLRRNSNSKTERSLGPGDPKHAIHGIDGNMPSESHRRQLRTTQNQGLATISVSSLSEEAR